MRFEAAHRGIHPDQLDHATHAHLQAETLRAQFPDMEFTSGSQRTDGTIEETAYDDSWPARFAEWRARLAVELGPVAIRIEHVGSTAVPGLAAMSRSPIMRSSPTSASAARPFVVGFVGRLSSSWDLVPACGQLGDRPTRVGLPGLPAITERRSA